MSQSQTYLADFLMGYLNIGCKLKTEVFQLEYLHSIIVRDIFTLQIHSFQSWTENPARIEVEF